MKTETLCTNVAELRLALRDLPPTARIHTTSPPFHGIRLVEQDSGAWLITAPKEEPTSRKIGGPVS